MFWEAEVSGAEKLACGNFYISTEFGNFGLQEIKTFITLHSTREIKAAVRQEIDWFNESYATPKSVEKYPSNVPANNEIQVPNYE